MINWLRNWLYSSMGLSAPTAALPPEPEAPLTPWARYWRVLRASMLALVAVGLVGGAGWYWLSHRHADWAVIVVAGDNHAHDGSHTEAFDNARRDVSALLVGIGFKRENMAQFSSFPGSDQTVQPADGPTIAAALAVMAERTDGCLLYFSSHGGPSGMLMGGVIVAPENLKNLLDRTCGTKPTVVIISACFSGVFIPVVKADNRMIMTAARPDRTSFGCGQDDRYPYFDTCVIQNLPAAHGFPQLADKVRDCVAKREAETGQSPPSEPQTFIGRDVAAHLPTWN